MSIALRSGHSRRMPSFGLILAAILAFLAAAAPPARADRIRSLSLPSNPSADQIIYDVLQVPRNDETKQPGLDELKLAISSYREGKFDDALAAFRNARSAHGSLAPAELMLARLFLADGQIPAARNALEQAAVAAPDDPEIYLVFGEFALYEGRLTDASLHYQHAAQLLAAGDTSTAINRKRQTQVHTGLAAIAERRGQWNTAEEQLAAAIKLEPGSSAAWQRQGRVLFELKRTKEAGEAFARAETLDPDVDPAAIAMGRLYHLAGNRAKADEWMAYAVKKDAKNPRVRVAVALWNLETDRPNDAQTHLDEAARLDPVFPELQRLQGLAARYRRDWSAAAAIFQTLFTENPADFAASNQLALVLVEQEEPQQRRAVQLAELNARQYPQNAEALATLGWVYYRLKRLDDAERVLQGAVSGGRLNSETAYYLAQVLIAREQIDEARKLLEGALAATGPFMFRTEAQVWLAEHPAATEPEEAVQ